MRRFLIAAVAVAAMGLFTVSLSAKDEDAKSGGKEVSGVLIDTKCGGDALGKDNPEESAEGHPKSCALKCGKDGGYGVINGKKLIKFDDKGNELATKYLEVEENATKVVVVGSVSDDGDTIQVTEIRPAGEKSEGEEGAK